MKMTFATKAGVKIKAKKLIKNFLDETSRIFIENLNESLDLENKKLLPSESRIDIDKVVDKKFGKIKIATYSFNHKNQIEPALTFEMAMNSCKVKALKVKDGFTPTMFKSKIELVKKPKGDYGY